MKVGKGIELLGMTGPASGRAQLNMRVPFAETLVVPELSAEVKTAMASFAATPRSLGMGGGEGINPGLTQGDVFPNEQTDYIYPKFRVLSAVLIPGYWIDFSVGAVLKESMPLLSEQTLYCDHIYWRTREWVGVVNTVVWDEKPDKAGAPGINSEMKVDWRKAPDIARGLLMKPPAVRAVSATVDFDWDASHPELMEKRIFWQSLGENIDGEIVRLKVTKITDYYEVSFVYKGANPGSNGHLPDDDEAELSAPGSDKLRFVDQRKPDDKLKLVGPPKEKNTVKLTDAQLKALGLEAQAKDGEVADSFVISTAESLAARAAAADGIVSAERAEVLRLATLSEGVGEDKKLPESLSQLIAGADASQLPGLKTLYAERAELKFPKTCQSCGSKNLAGRSSVEEQEIVENKPALQDTNLL